MGVAGRLEQAAGVPGEPADEMRLSIGSPVNGNTTASGGGAKVARHVEIANPSARISWRVSG